MTTLIDLYRAKLESSRDKRALLAHGFPGETWDDVAKQVDRVGMFLIGRGVQPGQLVASISENRWEWVAIDLGILSAGAVHVPLHPTLAIEQMLAQLRHAEPTVLFVSKLETAQRLRSVGLPESIRTIVALDADRPQPLDFWLDWTFVVMAGEQVDPAELERRRDAVRADTVATVIYTSGTTGRPKGVVLTHGNLASNARGVCAAYSDRPGDLRLNMLPLSHIYARTCDLYTWLIRDTVLAFARSRETILEDCRAYRPNSLNSVPYFYQRVLRGLREKGLLDTPGALKQALGGEIRICYCGGARLPEEVYELFLRQGVLLLQGYGLTETSPVITASTPDRHAPGSVGPTIPGVEVHVADDGEIVTRGPHVMRGYYRDEAATAEVLSPDGWFRTGDLGQIDDDGMLRIVGRKKEMIVTAAGKNVHPAYLESLLAQEPLIEQVCIVGEGRKHLAALIVPNPERLRAEIKRMRLWVFSKGQALRHRKVLALYREAIDRRLACVSHHEQAPKFVLLDRAFAIEKGETTPKLSLCRAVIEANYRGLVERIYQE
ncbi:MAG TPA: AMP-dependent synthetase/ligase [Pirellulaceae bacterium]|jgi:long-chain acyl-CoA synthetase|nr:AMP-dependent synthetase/ligase [Pirellulaceae bacterium]